MKYLWIIVFIICRGDHLFAQTMKAIQLSFQLKWDKEMVHVDDTSFYLLQKDTVRFSLFKCYISHLVLSNDHTRVWEEKESYHLLNGAIPKTLFLNLESETKSFNTISFCIGIDSQTNISGARGGVLDPMKGMYWTWQSGYINFKLEGIASSINTRNHDFHYHIGGYEQPFQTIQTIELKKNSGDSIVIIAIDLKHYFEHIAFREMPNIMSPGKEAVKLSAAFAKSFKIESQ